jgi:cyclophilin family peptidyl-prolyl cis-trans isomerase
MSLFRARALGRALPTLVTVETSAGPLVLELAPESAPRTVANFLDYVRAGYYEGLVFHRVIPGFVAQAGGYTADGKRKAPLRPPIPLEPSSLKHTDAALGMARLPEANSATSEWYVCDGAQQELDGKYCVFGRLIDGRDTLRRILSGPRKSDDWPKEPVVITRAFENAAVVPSTALVTKSEAEVVRAAARKLRGRAAMLRARKPLLAIADVEAAIAQADRTAKPADLARAEALLNEKERK